MVEVGPGHGQAQTRATQWSLPSGRLGLEVRGGLAVEAGEHAHRIMPRSRAHTTWGSRVAVSPNGQHSDTMVKSSPSASARAAKPLRGAARRPPRRSAVRGGTVPGAGFHPPGQVASVVVADLVRDGLGRSRAEQVEGPGEQVGQHTVLAERQRERVGAGRPVALRRAARRPAGVPRPGDLDVDTRPGQLLEVVRATLGEARTARRRQRW